MAESPSTSNDDTMGSLLLVGRSEIVLKLIKSINEVIIADKNLLKIHSAYIPSLVPTKTNKLDLELLCPPEKPSFILVIVEETETDPLKIAAKEIGHLPARFLTKKCVDVILWRRNNEIRRVSPTNLFNFVSKFQLQIHVVMADIDSSRETNAMKFYNRLKGIIYNPEVTSFVI